jgi:hypothetical protein
VSTPVRGSDAALPLGRERPLPFTAEMASHLHRFAFDCIAREYPNKPGPVLGSDADLRPPRQLHPAFHGCFDWHSAVHGHWTLVRIHSAFPDLPDAEAIVERLRHSLTADNVRGEVAFFESELNRTFERTYGWAWLLKLAEAVRAWEHPVAAELHANLLPLEELLAERLAGFLGVLEHPIRSGEHPNTAFALSLAHDYAARHHPALLRTIEARARDYFLHDRGCPVAWEPGGYDFLSPCLQEASLMAKALPAGELGPWLEAFLPGFAERPEASLAPVAPADRSDGKLAHLDGLSFSRAWCLFELGKALESERLTELGRAHFRAGYAGLDAGEYAGAHWLATFATLALLGR